MDITSLAISEQTDLLSYLRHNTTLFKNPDIHPYLDADIKVKQVRQKDIHPGQSYVYTHQLNFMENFDRALQEKYKFSFLDQKGFITYKIDGGETYTMYPPIVESTDDTLLLIDGTHRMTYADRKNGWINVVIVKNVAKDILPSILPIPGG